MRFVEGVGGKLFPVGPYLIQGLLIVSVFLSSCQKLLFQGVHLVDHLLSHCFTQFIGLAPGEVGQ